MAASISDCVRCCMEEGTRIVTVPSSMSMILLLHLPVEYNASFFWEGGGEGGREGGGYGRGVRAGEGGLIVSVEDNIQSDMT